MPAVFLCIKYRKMHLTERRKKQRNIIYLRISGGETENQEIKFQKIL